MDSLQKLDEKNFKHWLLDSFSLSVSDFGEPRQKSVLQVYVHRYLDLGQTRSECAQDIAEDLIKAWDYSNGPPKEKRSLVVKIHKLYDKYVAIKKNRYVTFDGTVKTRHAFIDDLHNFFEIGRRPAKSRKSISPQPAQNLANKIQQIDSDLESECDLIQEEVDEEDYRPPEKITRKFVHSDFSKGLVSSTLDRAGLSTRAATFVIAALAGSLNIDIDTVPCSKETLRKMRAQTRAGSWDKIKDNFDPTSFCTLHWDGKKMKLLDSSKKCERMAVLVSGTNGDEQLLGVPHIPSGSGQDQAEMIYLLLLHWNLEESITGVCADTTASNTGINIGAWMLLESMLGRKLIYYACRHHMHECILSSVFDDLFEPSSGPNIQLFGKFKDDWPETKNHPYESASSDEEIWYLLKPLKKGLTKFVLEQLNENQPRKDYTELLNLVLLFIGKPANMKITLRQPGAVHRARWMAKVIYCLKIYIFRHHFPLSDDDLCALRIFNVFVVKVYLKYWFTCELPTQAPRNDLKLLQQIKSYERLNPVVSERALKTFSGHTWYLDEILVGLSFFDSRISVQEKRLMVQSLHKPGNYSRDNIAGRRIEKLGISDFVTKETNKFFSIHKIAIEFLDKDPALWMKDPGYKNALIKVQKLKVTNDIAEQALSMADTYNGKITQDEGQFQNLLLSVKQHRKIFDSCTKRKIAGGLETLNNV